MVDMDIQSRAEDEIRRSMRRNLKSLLPPKKPDTASGGLTAADGEIVSTKSSEVEVTSDIKLASKTASAKLSAEELISDAPTMPEVVVEESPEMEELEA